MNLHIVIYNPDRTGEQTEAHLQAGAERVLVTAPCKDGDVTLIAGITAFARASVEALVGILGYYELPLVSSDFRGDSRSTLLMV